MGSNEKGAVAPAAPTSSEDDAITHLFRYSDHRQDTSYSNFFARCGVVIIPCTSVWSSSSLLIRRRISATSDVCCPAAEKRHDATKAKVPKWCSALSEEGMQARQTRAAFRRESAKASRPSICCARREDKSQGVMINVYHTDIFNTSNFMEELLKKQQKLKFSGAGA